MSHAQNIQMLEVVAQALGPELCQDVAFVGGCTTALLLTDELSREDVRHTDDVDLVIHLTGYPEWQKLVEQLRQKGFRQSPQDDVVTGLSIHLNSGCWQLTDSGPLLTHNSNCTFYLTAI